MRGWWLGWPRHMALDHMPPRPCATASDPQATSANEKAGSGAGLSASRLNWTSCWRPRCRLAGTPSAATRLGAINTISVHRLSVLRIRWGVWHLSLGYDAGKLGELGVGHRVLTTLAIASIGNAGAKAEHCGGGGKRCR